MIPPRADLPPPTGAVRFLDGPLVGETRLVPTDGSLLHRVDVPGEWEPVVYLLDWVAGTASCRFRRSAHVVQRWLRLEAVYTVDDSTVVGRSLHWSVDAAAEAMGRFVASGRVPRDTRP